MSLAQETIARATLLKAESDKANDLTLAIASAAQGGSQLLWDDLRDYMERQAKELATGMPAAEFLRSIRLGPDNLTIDTSVLPFVKLEVFRRGMFVTACYMETLNGVSEPMQRSLGRFRFTADRQLLPCFADESGNLHPQQVGDRLLKPVCDFLLRHPPMSVF